MPFACLVLKSRIQDICNLLPPSLGLGIQKLCTPGALSWEIINPIPRAVKHRRFSIIAGIV
jgi:hypothetical protein